ncbi:helix-turn-helix domain-containing protein [Sphingosinicella terrae]|uniref:helix-turn-helix domain-containing protein n=1 Tax=Sphingosinicella terrae TaxID=2172047 RepID=UPI000E0D3152|nr:helix-turn-helix domain-containing protein [Sphingosinicella terrae]
MDYAEHPAPAPLAGLVKAFWSLDAGAAGPLWIDHRAVPDGCVEVIRRSAGRSRWGGEQPACFAVGLIERPATFAVGRGSRFDAVRLWPWTWSLLSPEPLASLRSSWRPIVDPNLLGLCERLHDPAAASAFLAGRLAEAPAGLRETGLAILSALRVEDLRRAAGLSPRGLQRWFARNVGMAPRTYLRLLRFERAFAEVPDRLSLADHALASGFADQPHMNRDFRTLAGQPPARARKASKGPFLPG